MKRIILGTVQLGLPYGVNNGVMPDREYSLRLLGHAYDLGIRELDTASAYGEALDVIGDYHSRNPLKKFNVFSKFLMRDIGSGLAETLAKQCERLNVEKIDGFYFHHFKEYEQNSELFSSLKEHREKVNDLGVSIYHPEEFNIVSQDPRVDIIQVPMSIFHHNSSMKKRLVERERTQKVYARSIYLQGLLFLPESKLTGKLSPFINVNKFIENKARELKLAPVEMAAAYVMDMEALDGVLFGAESLEQVNESAVLKKRNIDWEYILKDMPIVNEDLLNPGNWK